MATEMGRKFNIPIYYNEAADKKSWADMNAYFAELLNGAQGNFFITGFLLLLLTE